MNNIRYFLFYSRGFANDKSIFATDREDVAKHLDDHEYTREVHEGEALRQVLYLESSSARPVMEYADQVQSDNQWIDMVTMMVDHANYKFKKYGYVII